VLQDSHVALRFRGENPGSRMVILSKRFAPPAQRGFLFLASSSKHVSKTNGPGLSRVPKLTIRGAAISCHALDVPEQLILSQRAVEATWQDAFPI
jgi:hypothetical protein